MCHGIIWGLLNCLCLIHLQGSTVLKDASILSEKTGQQRALAMKTVFLSRLSLVLPLGMASMSFLCKMCCHFKRDFTMYSFLGNLQYWLVGVRQYRSRYFPFNPNTEKPRLLAQKSLTQSNKKEVPTDVQNEAHYV